MSRGHDDPAIVEVRLHQSRELVFGGLIEPGGRLIEQPDGAVADEQPGDGCTTPLACRQIAEGQVADIAESDDFQRLAAFQVRLAQKFPPEAEILGHGQRGLHRVFMTEIVARRRDGRKDIAAPLDPGRPRGRRQQTRQNAQQGRFSGAVRACDDQALAGFERKSDAGENLLAAALAAQIVGDEPHLPPSPIVRRACVAAILPIVGLELF